jgi:hypothetical protein
VNAALQTDVIMEICSKDTALAHRQGSWSSITFSLLSTISRSALPCSSLQARNTSSRITRRGARLPDLKLAWNGCKAQRTAYL